MNLADLPPLREALAAAGIQARRRLGQHFLLDLNLCRKIARLSGVGPGDSVIEVGPGPGGLTRALVETGAEVTTIEKDSRFAPILRDLASVSGGRLRLVEADALEIDEQTLAGVASAATHVVANLPYNVGSPLLIKWLTGRFRPRTMTLMFQKEVALRLIAPPGVAAYGRLSVVTQALCEARIVLEAPARAFAPPPKVNSAVVRLTLRSPPPCDTLVAGLQEATRAAFGQRRKMLRSSLRELGGERLCAAAGIEASLRAQDLAVEDYMRLAALVGGR